MLLRYGQLKYNIVYEAVYLYLINNYYVNGKPYWVTNNDIDQLNREYNRLLPLSYGKQAPAIVMNLANNQKQSLYTVDAAYTILYFHNYDCSICQTTGKALQKLMFKSDPEQIKTFAVCLGESDKDCKKYSKQFATENWINVYEEKKANTVALHYRIERTPTIYLLDKKKAIIGKNLTVKQVESFLLDIRN